MATANLLIKFLAYSDKQVTYDPKLYDANWFKEIEDIITEDSNNNLHFDSLTRVITAGATSSISLLAATITFLYVECDGTIYIRLNGDIGNTNVVSPSADGVRDGIYLKRGDITSLDIHNPGADDINAKIFMGV